MGTGSSAVALANGVNSKDCDCSARRNRDIEEHLKRERVMDRRTIKLLLLGAAESGKSTFAKQMRIIHCDGFTDCERGSYKRLVHSNLLNSMMDVLNAMEKLNISLDSPDRIEDCKLVSLYAELTERSRLGFDKEVAGAIKRLSNDLGVRQCIVRAREYQLNDSAEYYFNEVERIAGVDYLPTNQDILRTRQKTSGVLETKFNFRDFKFRVFDVGGQRSERRKWIHYFDNVTAIIFTAALSAYDQVLREDDRTNRMHESLNLFSSICGYKCFTSTSVILFLNKKDIFQRKIKTSPLTRCFPRYTGANEFTEAVSYIQETFEGVNGSPKEIYTHVTVATDTQNMQFVFDASMALILKQHLEEAGLF